MIFLSFERSCPKGSSPWTSNERRETYGKAEHSPAATAWPNAAGYAALQVSALRLPETFPSLRRMANFSTDVCGFFLCKSAGQRCVCQSLMGLMELAPKAPKNVTVRCRLNLVSQEAKQGAKCMMLLTGCSMIGCT